MRHAFARDYAVIRDSSTQDLFKMALLRAHVSARLACFESRLSELSVERRAASYPRSRMI